MIRYSDLRSLNHNFLEILKNISNFLCLGSFPPVIMQVYGPVVSKHSLSNLFRVFTGFDNVFYWVFPLTLISLPWIPEAPRKTEKTGALVPRGIQLFYASCRKPVSRSRDILWLLRSWQVIPIFTIQCFGSTSNSCEELRPTVICYRLDYSQGPLESKVVLFSRGQRIHHFYLFV